MDLAGSEAHPRIDDLEAFGVREHIANQRRAMPRSAAGGGRRLNTAALVISEGVVSNDVVNPSLVHLGVV